MTWELSTLHVQRLSPYSRANAIIILMPLKLVFHNSVQHIIRVWYQASSTFNFWVLNLWDAGDTTWREICEIVSEQSQNYIIHTFNWVYLYFWRYNLEAPAKFLIISPLLITEQQKLAEVAWFKFQLKICSRLNLKTWQRRDIPTWPTFHRAVLDTLQCIANAAYWPISKPKGKSSYSNYQLKECGGCKIGQPCLSLFQKTDLKDFVMMMMMMMIYLYDNVVSPVYRHTHFLYPVTPPVVFKGFCRFSCF